MFKLASVVPSGLKTPLLSMAWVVLVGATPSLANDFKIINGVRLQEADIRTPIDDRSLRDIGLDACRAACRAETVCVAFTYRDKGQWCVLKGIAGQQDTETGYTSGIRIASHGASRAEGLDFFGVPSRMPAASSAMAPPLPRRRPAIPRGAHPPQERPGSGAKTASRSGPQAFPVRGTRASTHPSGLQPAPKVRKPVRPMVETDKDARALYKVLKTAGSHAKRAEQISARYLRRYDTAKAGPRTVEGPFGIRVSVHFNRSMARALVLDKMGKDPTLKALQGKLARFDTTSGRLFKRVANKLDPRMRRTLTSRHSANIRSARALRAARGKLVAHGRILNGKAARMQFPSEGELRTLHRLAATMRVKRRSAIRKARVFRDTLGKALRGPMVAGYVRRVSTGRGRR